MVGFGGGSGPLPPNSRLLVRLHRVLGRVSWPPPSFRDVGTVRHLQGSSRAGELVSELSQVAPQTILSGEDQLLAGMCVYVCMETNICINETAMFLRRARVDHTS